MNPPGPSSSSEAPGNGLRARAWNFGLPTALFAVYALWHAIAGRLVVHIPHEFWQFLPVGPLTEHPLQSLWYLHSQPPVMNALLWLVEALPGAPAAWATMLFLAVAWVSVVLWSANFRWMTGSQIGGTVMTALYLLHPAFILHQNTFFYTHLVQCLMAGIVWLAIRWADERRPGWLLGIAGALALLVYTRSLWHPVVALPVLALLALWGARGAEGSRWRAWGHVAWRPALLFAVLVAPWMIKNAVLFGSAGFSSWMGLSLRGEQSRVFLEQRTYDEELVAAYYGPDRLARYEAVPVLSLREKDVETGIDFMRTNLNHLAVVPLGRADVAAKWREYTADPRAYATRSVAHLFFLDLPPMVDPYTYDVAACQYRYHDLPARQAPVWLQRLYDHVLYGRWLRGLLQVEILDFPARPSAWLVLYMPAILIGAVLAIRRGWGTPEGLVLALAYLLVAWFTAMILLVDGIEAARMKWEVEALTWLLAAGAVRGMIGRSGNRQAPAPIS